MSHDLPPGFRFHPTDEELILYYLSYQSAARPCPVPIIPELNIYNYDPWELPGKSDMADGEWYFFSPRHRKYPNGARPNRATASGYWKATGTDKAIHSASRYVGVKKALVFYMGRPPRGSKTEWIMHEYRLDSTKPNGSTTTRVLDEWVLCRIYKKKQQKSSIDDRPQDSASLPRSCSLAHLLDSDYISASQLFEDNPLGSVDDLFDGSSGGGDAAVALAGIQSGLLNPKSIFEH